MSALADLQRALQARVLRNDDDPMAAVVDTQGADAAQRLRVYTHAYRARLAGVLRDDYPGLRALAGDEDFEALALAYVDATPSTHPNVRWYGAKLPTFLRERAPWSARVEFGEMAELDWALGLAFDAADDATVDFAALAALAPADWPALRLRLHPSLQRACFTHDVAAIRRALDREEALPVLETAASPQPWAAWRKDAVVRHRNLGDDEAAALDAVVEGANFAELCERLCDRHAPEHVAARAAALLRRWIDDGWIAAFATGPVTPSPAGA